MESFKVKVIERSDNNKFEADVETLMNDGYELKSCSCGFLNSESHQFCNWYQAVLVKKEISEPATSPSNTSEFMDFPDPKKVDEFNKDRPSGYKW